MGRIKSKLIKRTGNTLINEENNFTDKFEDNKEQLKGLMPGKKIRNQIAGHITRQKKNQQRQSK